MKAEREATRDDASTEPFERMVREILERQRERDEAPLRSLGAVLHFVIMLAAQVHRLQDRLDAVGSVQGA